MLEGALSRPIETKFLMYVNCQCSYFGLVSIGRIFLLGEGLAKEYSLSCPESIRIFVLTTLLNQCIPTFNVASCQVYICSSFEGVLPNEKLVEIGFKTIKNHSLKDPASKNSF